MIKKGEALVWLVAIGAGVTLAVLAKGSISAFIDSMKAFFASLSVPSPVKDAAQQVGIGLGIVTPHAQVAPWVGNNSPLTAIQADGIAKWIGLDSHGGGYSMSPDRTQIWFFDGSYYDNGTGHYYDAQGNDQGPIAVSF